MLQNWNVHCSSVATPGKEAVEWFSLEFTGFSLGRSLSRAQRPWKTNLQQHLLLSTAVEELGGKVFNMADGRNACRKNKGWMRLRNKRKSKEELTRNCIFLPNCRNSFRCPGCVIFLLTGLLFVHVFIWSSKAKETPEWMQPCLLQCPHTSPSYWISSACQFDVEVAEIVVLPEASQCLGKGSVYY